MTFRIRPRKGDSDQRENGAAGVAAADIAPLTLSFFRDKRDRVPTERELPWPDVVAELSNHRWLESRNYRGKNAPAEAGALTINA